MAKAERSCCKSGIDQLPVRFLMSELSLDVVLVGNGNDGLSQSLLGIIITQAVAYYLLKPEEVKEISNPSLKVS